MIRSIDTEKYDKIQRSFIIKTLRKIEIEGNFLNLVKSIYKTPTANIIFKNSSLSLGKEGRVSTFTTLIQHDVEVEASEIRK